MALFLESKSEQMHWAVWKMEESPEVLLSLLPDRRREACVREMQRFVSERRKMEWLSVRVLFYSMLREDKSASREDNSLRWEDKEIAYSAEGKPFLADHSFFISISHTKGYVAVIMSAAAPVGIDIEQYGRRVHRVADRYIRADERVEAGETGDATWSLLLHWSAKETIFKRMEKADADLRKLRLCHFIPREKGLFQVQEFATESQRIYSVGYRICPDFVLTWSVD